MPRLRSVVVLLSIIPAILLGACGDSDKVTGPAPTIEATTFAPSLGIDLSTFTKTTGGLYYKDLVVGQGAVVGLGQFASVRYAGYFTSGVSFDSTKAGDPLLEFQVGRGQVIEGWDIGAIGMRVGGQRQLIIPPSLGYGSSDYRGIPGNSILVFKVTMVSVR